MMTWFYKTRPISFAVAICFDRNPKQWGETMAFSPMASLPIVMANLVSRRLFLRSPMSSEVKV